MVNTIRKRFKTPQATFMFALAIATLLCVNGYCEEAHEQSINEVSNKISDFLFGSTVRKVALTLGMGAGLFQAFMSGSIRPLLIYGGLGLAVCYLPKVVQWISTIG